MRNRSGWSAVALVGMGMVALTGGVPAQGVGAEPLAIEIPEQPLNDALKALAQQAGFQVVFYSRESEGLAAKRLSGTYTRDQALKKLLDGTGLEYRYLDAQTVAVTGKDKKRADVAAD